MPTAIALSLAGAQPKGVSGPMPCGRQHGRGPTTVIGLSPHYALACRAVTRGTCSVLSFRTVEAYARRYIDIDMPELFELETLSEGGEWIVWGRFEASMFGRLEDGTYVCAGHGGSPLFLRCLRQDGGVIDVLDGCGDRYRYRLEPVLREPD